MRFAGMVLFGKRLAHAGGRIERRRIVDDVAAGEVALAHQVARHRSRLQQRLVLAAPLVVAEEERPVLDHRAADRAPDLVQAELGLLLVLGREVIPGVEPLAADEAEPAAAELVATRLGDDVDLRAAGVAVLGAVGAREDLELGDRVERRLDDDHPGGVVAVRHPVEHEVVAVLADAVHLHRAAEVIERRVRLRRQRAWQKQRQLHEIAAAERQLIDRLRGHHLAERRGFSVDERRLRRDRQRLGNGADLQLQVDARPLVDLQADAGRGSGLEPVELRGDAVGANRQVGHQVVAGRVGH